MKHPNAEPGPASQVKRIAAIILAAGYSSRMGTLKPLLKIGDKTILERAIRLFRELGVEDVIVVVGHGAEHIIPLVHDCGAREVMNAQFKHGMFSSVQAGVNALMPASEAFFVLPVDIPLVRSQTIRDLLEAYRGGKSKIVVPCFGEEAISW
jgi:CTP:molybdopterin cytidylyltransferase MocA